MRIAPFALVAALLMGAASVSQAAQPVHVHRHSAHVQKIVNHNAKGKHGKHGKHGGKKGKHGKKHKN